MTYRQYICIKFDSISSDLLFLRARCSICRCITHRFARVTSRLKRQSFRLCRCRDGSSTSNLVCFTTTPPAYSEHAHTRLSNTGCHREAPGSEHSCRGATEKLQTASIRAEAPAACLSEYKQGIEWCSDIPGSGRDE